MILLDLREPMYCLLKDTELNNNVNDDISYIQHNISV